MPGRELAAARDPRSRAAGIPATRGGSATPRPICASVRSDALAPRDDGTALAMPRCRPPASPRRAGSRFGIGSFSRSDRGSIPRSRRFRPLQARVAASPDRRPSASRYAPGKPPGRSEAFVRTRGGATPRKHGRQEEPGPRTAPALGVARDPRDAPPRGQQALREPQRARDRRAHACPSLSGGRMKTPDTSASRCYLALRLEVISSTSRAAASARPPRLLRAIPGTATPKPAAADAPSAPAHIALPAPEAAPEPPRRSHKPMKAP